MFATSTKTATFLPTLTPIWCWTQCRRADAAWLARSTDATAGSGGHDGPLDGRSRFDESLVLPTGAYGGVLRLRRLHDGAALVLGRAEDLLEEGRRQPVRIVVGVEDEEVDRADVTAGPDRWTEGEDRATDHFAPRLGDEDARL